MHNLNRIKLSDLFDMLSEYTSRYMKMLSDGATKDEFNECRETIIDIQAEIHLRQNKRSEAIRDISFKKDLSRHKSK